MGDDRALSALARIERALARVETAAERVASASPPTADGGDERLAAAHEALRAKVGQAIEQIDRLIAAAEMP